VAKGAVYTHGVFAAQVELLKAVYGIEPGEVDFCTFPLFALFGPALGMTCVVPDMDFARPARIDPRKAVAQVAQFQATNLFGSPAVVRALGSYGASLPSLRRAISAGAPARADQLERFARLLAPGVEVFTPYGATEALPVANISSGEILTETRRLTDRGKGVCVGRPVPGVTVRVIGITDDAIPEWDDARILPDGQIGEFAVSGPVVTAAYFGRAEATRLAKIRGPRTGALWHRMGDVGYYDDAGRLWFCGRKSHRVVTPHGTLFTDQVEPVFNTVNGVSRTALVGVTRDGVTHPVLCVERWSGRHILAEAQYRGVKVRLEPPRPWEWLAAELRTTAALCEHTRAGVTFLEHPGSFPVDVRHNSKIFREKLAAWADRKLGPAWRPTV
jgi:acyl-CoA synthetase (AMP-forming)/AMP-acid ligase II